MREIKADYSEFKKAIVEVAECGSGWDVVVDLDDGVISVKHSCNRGIGSIVLVRGYNIDADTDLSDENIKGVFGFDYIADSVDNATCGEVKVICSEYLSEDEE